MNQYAPGLLALSVLVFLGATFYLIPSNELIVLPFYFLMLAMLATLSYVGGIKPVDAEFSGALFSLAFVLKLIGGLARYWIVADVYQFRADAPLYHEQGQFVAQFYRQ